MNKLMYALVILALMGASFVIGLLINDFPQITFKREVSLDTMLSFVGIIGAIILVPLVINRYYSRRDTTNSLVISDVDGALVALETVGKLYKELNFSEKVVDNNDRREIQSTLRKVSNHLKTIVDKTEKHPGLEEFRIDVYEYFNENTYKSCTEQLSNGKVVDDNLYLQVDSSINVLVNRLRNTKYNLA